MTGPKAKKIPSPDPQHGERLHYTQVNILFPSEQVELPSAEKFTAFPPDAQKAILAAFEREQIERHAWLKNQQTNEHTLNMQGARHYFYWRMAGLLSGVILALGVILTGAWLVAHGASSVGIATMIGAAVGLIGTAVYGHKAAEKAQKPKAQSSDVERRA